MSVLDSHALPIILQRLDDCYSGAECDWKRFYQPRWERANFATRYHLVYPALAYFILLKQQPNLAPVLRPKLDTMYRGLLHPRSWTYWHTELGEATWPLQERNLTFAGRLATFVGFYVDAFGVPPAARIEFDGYSTTYSLLSENLWRQMTVSPSKGVSCYHHESMVMCNAHLLINNVLHDRLFGTNFASSNQGWLDTLENHLVRQEGAGPLFFFGTQPNSCAAAEQTVSLGVDIWSLFLMSGVIPDRVRDWFGCWQDNIIIDDGKASVEIASSEMRAEASSTLLATAWTFALAKELGELELAATLRTTLEFGATTGYELDPLISGLYLLGNVLEPGGFRRLVVSERSD